MFADMSIKKKLFLLCTTILMFTFITGFISYKGFLKLDENLKLITHEAIPETLTIDNMYLEFTKTRVALRTIGLEGISETEAAQAIEEVHQHIALYEKYQTEYEKNLKTAEQKEIFLRVKNNWNDLKNIGVKAIGLFHENTSEAKKRMTTIFLVDCPKAADIYDKSVNELLLMQKNHIDKITTASLMTSQNDRNLQAVIILVSIVIGMLVGLLFTKHINNLLEDISNNVGEGTEKLKSIAANILEVSTSLESNMDQQTISLQQTTTSLEEANVSIVSNAQSTKKSLVVSEETMGLADRAQKAMGEATITMKEISTSIQEIEKAIEVNNKEISNLVTVIEEINSKTKVINEIVFQTKLLSFNASVEAARAGEHGKGFSVVAEEIGNLATKSGDSAKDISLILEKSMQKVEATVSNSEIIFNKYVTSSNEKVKVGNHIILECEENLNNILMQIRNLNSLVGNISHSTDEQTSSMREITQAMNQIDHLNKNNNNNARENFKIVQNLEGQLGDFSEIIEQLKKTIKGKKVA